MSHSTARAAAPMGWLATGLAADLAVYGASYQTPDLAAPALRWHVHIVRRLSGAG